MLFRIINTSGKHAEESPHKLAIKKDDAWHINIDTLDEFKKLLDESDDSLIITGINGEYEIEIYDYYRE